MRYAARLTDIATTHQALAEVSRLRLLETLRAREDGLSAAEAAAEVGLHQATTRQHLELLVEAGLARSPAAFRVVNRQAIERGWHLVTDSPDLVSLRGMLADLGAPVMDENDLDENDLAVLVGTP